MLEREERSSREAFVVGQKYAFATASLVVALLCFVNVAALEKAIVAVLFGVQALRIDPPPLLPHRRGWARAGVVLGGVFLVVVPAIVWYFLGVVGLREVFETLVRLGAAK
jgi:hypothetical protein